MDPSTSTQSADSDSGLQLKSEGTPATVAVPVQQLPHSTDNIVKEVKNAKVDDADAAEQQTRSRTRSRTLSSSDPSSDSTTNTNARSKSNNQPQDQETSTTTSIKTKGQMKMKENESDDDDSNDSAVETRRFTRRFIQNVISSYENDAECAGNVAATAKKFGIHRKQLEKWLIEQQSDKTDAEHIETDPAPLTKEPSSTSTEDSASAPPHSEARENLPTAPTSTKGPGPRRESRRNKSTANTNAKPDVPRRKQVRDSNSKSDHFEEVKQKGVQSKGNCDLDLDGKTDPEEDAYDLRKMSSSSMALSLNLSMNSSNQSQSQPPARASVNNLHPNNTTMSSFALNNNNPYLTSSLLRLFPNANPFNYGQSGHGHALPPNSNGGSGLNKSSYSDRDRQRDSSDSPTNLSTASGGDSSQRTTPNNYSFGQNNNIPANPLDIVDEIAYLYPNEDYTLLRQALIRNEVTLTKLRKLTPAPEPGRLTNNPNNLSSHGNRRSSPSPKSVPSTAANSVPVPGLQQGLPIDLIRQQQSEYLKLLQQSGFTLPAFPANLGSDMPHSGFGGDPSSFPPWFHSLATATALGLVGNPVAAEQSSGAGSKNSRSKRPTTTNSSASTPTFATPKLPLPSSASSTLNSKPKTVAAALAASRTSPSNCNYRNASANPNANSPYSEYNSRNKLDKLSPRKRQRSKLPSMASRKSYSADEDFVDPTSMLEVVTTPASADADSFVKESHGAAAAAAAPSMNPIHFLNQLLLQSPGNKNIFPDLSMGKQLDDIAKAKPIFDTNGNGNGLDGGIGINQHQLESQKSVASDLSSSSDATKNMVLHAFFNDSDVNGDPRALARKFGLSSRVVMKWIKESSSRESRQLAMNGIGNHGSGSPENSYVNVSPQKIGHRVNGNGGSSPPTNGDLNLNAATMAKFMNNFETASMNNRCNIPPVNGGHDSTNNNETDSYLLPNAIASAKNLHKSINLNSTSSSVNKRKNSKPNQICDLEEDDSHSFMMDEPVDMMMPNKRPHLSHSQRDA